MRFLLLVWLAMLPAAFAAESATLAPQAHVNLRAGKSLSDRVVRVLPPGSRVEILEIQGSVARVRTATGETGWVPTRLIVTDGAPPAKVEAPPKAQSVAPTAAPLAAEALPEPVSPAKPASSASAKEEPASPWFPLATAVGGFLLGAVVGIAAHEAYYRKRLNGLRI